MESDKLKAVNKSKFKIESDPVVDIRVVCVSHLKHVVTINNMILALIDFI